MARLALDGLKAAHRQRETYVGPWLPEPLVEPMGTKPVEMAESLSLAFLRLLESLSPSERVAFLLREVFDAGYEEVAAALETSEANSRQIVARARKHIQERRPRFAVDRGRQSAVLREFLTACATGDPTQLTALLSEDAVLYTDGGGKVSAALNPIVGADRVVRFLIGIGRKIPALSVRVCRRERGSWSHPAGRRQTIQRDGARRDRRGLDREFVSSLPIPTSCRQQTTRTSSANHLSSVLRRNPRFQDQTPRDHSARSVLSLRNERFFYE